MFVCKTNQMGGNINALSNVSSGKTTQQVTALDGIEIKNSQY